MTAHECAPVRIARGCWVAPETTQDLAALCGQVLDSSAADSLIVGFSAARLYGLWLPGRDEPIHVATATPERLGRGMTRTRRSEFQAHRRQLPPEDRTVVCGVPATTLARTWRDLAIVLSPADLVAAGDSALRSGTTAGELAEVLVRTKGLRGARRAQTALGLLDERSRSRPESHLRVAISAPELPRFEANVPVYRDQGGWLGEPDLSLGDARIALEYQGEDHAELGRMRRDITRFKDFRDEGWEILPYGPVQVFGRPWEIRAEVRRALAARAPHLIVPTRVRRRRVVT